MDASLELFEAIARRAFRFTEAPAHGEATQHPFELRNIHERLPSVVKDLFDDGHFSQATFEAFKFIDKEIARHAKLSDSGFKLMMRALSEESPLVSLTPLASLSDKDEQRGYQFLFAGGTLAIRNPRGHEYAVVDDPDRCLDHLTLASLLLRRLGEAGFDCSDV